MPRVKRKNPVQAPQFITGVSPAWNKTRLIVLQSGPEKLGEWIWEKRNIYEDYKTLFGKEPPKANLISIYINSQHTKTRAESYFGEIYFSKNRRLLHLIGHPKHI